MGAAPQILGEAGDGDAPRYAVGDRNPVPLSSRQGSGITSVVVKIAR